MNDNIKSKDVAIEVTDRVKDVKIETEVSIEAESGDLNVPDSLIDEQAKALVELEEVADVQLETPEQSETPVGVYVMAEGTPETVLEIVGNDNDNAKEGE